MAGSFSPPHCSPDFHCRRANSSESYFSRCCQRDLESYIQLHDSSLLGAREICCVHSQVRSECLAGGPHLIYASLQYFPFPANFKECLFGHLTQKAELLPQYLVISTTKRCQPQLPERNGAVSPYSHTAQHLEMQSTMGHNSLQSLLRLNHSGLDQHNFKSKELFLEDNPRRASQQLNRAKEILCLSGRAVSSA